MTGIFIDLDGTLLNDYGKISQEDLKYLKSIKNEHNIYLITGLPLAPAKKFYDEIGLNTFLISSGGQSIWKDGKKNAKPFDEGEIKKLVDQYDDIAIAADSGFYSKGSISKYINHGTKIVNDPCDLKNIGGVYLLDRHENTNKFVTYDWDVGNGAELSILRPLGANKESALEFVAKEDKLDYTIMIGNGRADVEAMKMANVGIAMKNSYPDIFKDADLVSVDDNNNSGVSKTLKELLK